MPEPPHTGWKTGAGGRKGRLKNKWGKWLTAYNSGYQERIGLGGRESSAHNAQIHWYILIDIQRLYPPSQSLLWASCSQNTLSSSHTAWRGFKPSNRLQHLKSAAGSKLIPESVHFCTLLEMAKKILSPESGLYTGLETSQTSPRREEKQKGLQNGQ